MPEDMYDVEDEAEGRRLKLAPQDAARVRRERAAETVAGPRMLPGMAMIAMF